MPRHKRTLVLNADYTPLSVVKWDRAITLSLIGNEDPSKGAQVVEYYKDGDSIKDTRGNEYRMPAVIRVAKYIKIGKRIPFSRKNVFLRDQLRCQYCGKQYSPENLTYDHVIPRAKWKKQNHQKSPTQWENIVTACVACNRKKANKTPKEAKMHLIRPPQQPNPHGYILGLSPWSQFPEEWNTYLTPIYKNFGV